MFNKTIKESKNTDIFVESNNTYGKLKFIFSNIEARHTQLNIDLIITRNNDEIITENLVSIASKSNILGLGVLGNFIDEKKCYYNLDLIPSDIIKWEFKTRDNYPINCFIEYDIDIIKSIDYLNEENKRLNKNIKQQTKNYTTATKYYENIIKDNKVSNKIMIEKYIELNNKLNLENNNLEKNNKKLLTDYNNLKSENEKKIKELNNNNKLNNNLIDNFNKINSLESDNQKLLENYNNLDSDKKNKIDELKTAYNNLLNEYNVYKNNNKLNNEKNYDILLKDYKIIAEQNSLYKEEYTNIDSVINNLEKTNIKLEDNFNKMNLKNEKLKNHNNLYQKENLKIKFNIRRLKTKILDYNNHIKNLNKDNNYLKNENLLFQQEYSNIRSTILKLETKILDYNKQKLIINNLKKENSRLILGENSVNPRCCDYWWNILNKSKSI